MKDTDFKKQLIATLKLENVSEEVQNELLLQIEDLANARLGSALPELLSEEQLKHVEDMYKAKKSDDEIMEWIEAQLPKFEEMMQAIIMDIATELDFDAKK